MSEEDKPGHITTGANYTPLIPSKKEDVKLLRDLLENNPVTVVVGEYGTGKRSFFKYYYSEYKNKYDYVFNLDEFLYSVQYFNFAFSNEEGFKNLKQFFSETKKPFLIMVSNMVQYGLEDFIDKLKLYLPLDRVFEKDQHIVIKSYVPIPGFPSITVPPLTLDASKLLIRELVNYEISDTDILAIQEVTKGNLHFTLTMSRYINKYKQDDINQFLETLQKSEYNNPKKKLLKLILETEFQKPTEFSQIFNTFIWFHSYVVNKLWLEEINRLVIKKNPAYIDNFIKVMTYYDLYRDVQDGEYIPNYSISFFLRDLIPDKNECFNDFLYSMVMLLKNNVLSKADTMLLYRHLFYYLEKNEFSTDYEKATLYVVCAEGIHEHFYRTSEGLELALRALAITVEKDDPITARIHKNLGFMYASNEIGNFTEAIPHVTEAIRIFTANESKFPFKTKAYLTNHLGYCHTKLKLFKQAIAIHNQAMEYVENEKTIDYTETLYYMGLSYFEMGDYHKSIHYLRQSIRAGILYKFNLLDQYSCITKAYYSIGDLKKSNEALNSMLAYDYSPQVIEKYKQDFEEYKVIFNSKSSIVSSKWVISTSVLAVSALLFYKFYK